MTHRIVAIAGVVGLWLSALAQPPADLAAIAPRNTVAIVSVRDMNVMSEAMDRSGLGRLFDDPQIRAMIDSSTKDAMEEMRTGMKDAGIELDDLSMPSGLVGVAVFSRAVEDRQEWNFLACADYGDKADDFAKVIDTVIDAQIEKNEIEVKEEKFGDATVWTIDIVALMDEEDDVEVEFDFPEPPFSQIRSVYLGRLGRVFVLSSELGATEDALDVMQGRRRESLADNTDYQAAVAQLPRDAQMSGVVMLAPVRDQMLKPFFESMMFMFGGEMDLEGLFRALGLDNVQSAGFSMSMDTTDGIVESTQVLLVPEKRGLLGLFAGAGDAFVPPPFAGRDADGVSRISADFTKVVPMVRGIIETMPEDFRAQTKPAFEQVAAPLMDQVFAALGRDVYIVTNYQEPFTTESQQTVFAVPVKDDVVIGNAIQTLPIGLQATDFGGNVIYRSPDEMVPIVIGLGFGYAFIGPAPAVENAMRQAGNPEAGRLSDEAHFRAAASRLGATGIGYAWAAIAPQLRMMIAEMREAAAEEIDPEWGWEPTGIDKVMRDMGKAVPDAELFLKYFGDQVSEYNATPWGFRARSLLLRPRAQ